ncbi:MAG: pentapeptide repeat-containing protein [Acidobacteria bacterium]|nr:pentapeptide repeat-containing protein [Acidobacteriota bacterium]
MPAIEDLVRVDAEALFAGERIEESLVQNLVLSGRKIESLVAWNSIFDNVSLANSRVGKLRLRDVRLIKCDLSNAILQGFEAARVEFVDCRMTGMRACECHWEDVLIENCDLRYAQLSDSRIRSSEFRSCNLSEADLRGVNFESAIFGNAILRQADLSRARLQGIDLSGAEIEGFIVRPEDLRGAIFSAAQAIDLALLLGIVIK